MDVIVFFVVVKIIPEVWWNESRDSSQFLLGEKEATYVQDWKCCVVSEKYHVVTGYFSPTEMRRIPGVYTYGHY